MRLHGNFPARLGVLAEHSPSQHFARRRKLGRHNQFNMADKKHLLLKCSQVIIFFTALVLRQYGLLTIWKIQHTNQCNQMISFLQGKRNYRLSKLKLAKQRRLLRKKRRCWVTFGKTEQWWRNMIGGMVAEEKWRKNFRMAQEMFYELAEELRHAKHKWFHPTTGRACTIFVWGGNAVIPVV